jgi:WD40 repeat protein
MTKKLILLFMLIMFNVIANAEYKPDIIVQMGHTSRVSSLCYSPDGRYIVSASDDGKAKLWDTITGKVLRTFTGHEMGIYSVCFSPDGKYIVTGSVDNTIKKWDVENGREIGSFLGHEKIVQVKLYHLQDTRRK